MPDLNALLQNFLISLYASGGFPTEGVAAFVDAGNSGSALTINFTTGRRQRFVLTGNVTLTLSNPSDGARYLLNIGTGAGSFTVTWPASVSWPGGVTPTVTATASKTDLVVLVYNANTSKYYASISQAY